MANPLGIHILQPAWLYGILAFLTIVGISIFVTRRITGTFSLLRARKIKTVQNNGQNEKLLQEYEAKKDKMIGSTFRFMRF
ncbi:MAG: hypothetical protein ACE5I5_09620 [Candidatus Heimdallarchaeota archaeon]